MEQSDCVKKNDDNEQLRPNSASGRGKGGRILDLKRVFFSYERGNTIMLIRRRVRKDWKQSGRGHKRKI